MFSDHRIGKACFNDYDADEVPNAHDVCPNNSRISTTDFREYEFIKLDPEGKSQDDPIWVISNEGAEITQNLNSDPGIAVGTNYETFTI